MKSVSKKFFILLLAAMLALQPASEVQASAKSNADKMLSYYKKGSIKKAKQYNKKLSKKASNASTKNLSKKTKTAYRKIVKKYKLDTSLYSSEPYLWGYYLADMDGDKKAELLVQYGTCEADVRTAVYKYKGGKAKKVAQVFSGHTGYYAYPGHAGVISVTAHMDYENVATLTLKKGKLKSKSYGGRYANGNYFPFRQPLYGHIKYDSNYKPSLDLKDLL